MKRIAVYGIIMLVLFCSTMTVRAEESDSDKISTLILIKNDLITPHKGKSFFSQTFTPYVHYKWFGVGGDVTYAPRKDFLEIKPYVTINKGPIYALLGYQGNSLDQKFFQTGLWYWNHFGKLTSFVDLRNYWSANKCGISYLELWTNVYYPIRDRFYIGMENKYSHWWDPKKSHDQLFLGPLLGFKITKSMSVYTRPGVAWDVTDGKTKRDFCFRLGMKFIF